MPFKAWRRTQKSLMSSLLCGERSAVISIWMGTSRCFSTSSIQAMQETGLKLAATTAAFVEKYHEELKQVAD